MTGKYTLLPIPLVAKLASIVVHADEMSSPDGHPFDKEALRRLVGDAEVVEWMRRVSRAGLAPVKRT